MHRHMHDISTPWAPVRSKKMFVKRLTAREIQGRGKLIEYRVGIND